MPTDEKPAVTGSAVKEPRKAKTSEKNAETGESGTPVANDESTEATEAKQETIQPDDTLNAIDTPPVTAKAEHHAAKQIGHELPEQHGHPVLGRSIGRLMRFRRKKAKRR